VERPQESGQGRASTAASQNNLQTAILTVARMLAAKPDRSDGVALRIVDNFRA
jgi:hypothetical protein